MQFRIEKGCKNLIDEITLQIQKEKENKIQEGQQKILEEVELHLEDVCAKYDGIISKARVIKDQAKYAATNHKGLRPKIIEFEWMDHHLWKEESRNTRKSYYLVSSYVKPLTAKL
jgi:oligoribonuclease NrnB/cAMP/cGMP phosphodiesterase (DHH superfamily)